MARLAARSTPSVTADEYCRWQVHVFFFIACPLSFDSGDVSPDFRNKLFF
jgi:hypothetical protein